MTLFIAVYRYNAEPYYLVLQQHSVTVGEDRYGLPAFGKEVKTPWLTALKNDQGWRLLSGAVECETVQIAPSEPQAIAVGDAQIVLVGIE